MNTENGKEFHPQVHAHETHLRWIERRNRKQEDEEYHDEWYSEQCWSCRFWLPLTGLAGVDYGACSNPASLFDGLVRFEHDGCEHYAIAQEVDADNRQLEAEIEDY